MLEEIKALKEDLLGLLRCSKRKQYAPEANVKIFSMLSEQKRGVVCKAIDEAVYSQASDRRRI